MNLQNVHYIRIDANGDMVDNSYVSNDNIFYIMKETWNFTEEEVRAEGYAPVDDSIRTYVNGDSAVDIELGDIIKNDDGSFTQHWIEQTIPIEEKRVRFMDIKRINLLFTTDWTQLVDSPLSEELKTAYANYRQQLRDLPNTINWETIASSEDVVWPTVPGAELPDPDESFPVTEE